MEQPSNSSRRRDEPECSLREWALRSQVSRENTRSRRFSGSHIRSFRELEARSFRSNFTISSTASSPGYSLKEEIDPSTYSFTTAVKALQARSGYINSWECLSPEGFALNSKWNEAERYICNPLSGEVPMECLSAKTLSAKSFRYSLTNRVTMSAPLVYSYPIPRCVYAKPARVVATREEEDDDDIIDIVHHPSTKGNKMEGTTKDVGTQSTPTHELSSGSPSPTTSTPSIIERSFKRCELLSAQGEEDEDEDSPIEATKFKDVKVQVKEKETGKEVEERKQSYVKEDNIITRHNEQSYVKEDNIITRHNEQVEKWSTKRRQGNGCLFWIRRRGGKDKHLLKKKNKFLLSLESC